MVFNNVIECIDRIETIYKILETNLEQENNIDRNKQEENIGKDNIIKKQMLGVNTLKSGKINKIESTIEPNNINDEQKY